MVGGCKPIIGHNSNSTLGGVELIWSGDGVGLEWRWSWELSWSLAISCFLAFSYLMYISGHRSGILLRLHQQVCILSRLKFLKFAKLWFSGSGETLADPCDKWFCSPDKMKGGTQVKISTEGIFLWFYFFFRFLPADGVSPVRLSTQWPGTLKILRWAWYLILTPKIGVKFKVPGVNRTDYYQAACNMC